MKKTDRSDQNPHYLLKGNRCDQKAKIVWFTGLSGAGKTTLSKRIHAALTEQGFLVRLLDGDVIRNGLNNNLGFSEADRFENIRRIAEVSRLFLDSGIICINSFISPTTKIRAMAKRIIGADNYIEVYVNAPLSVCEKRDIKGLYKKARLGEIKNFTGIDAPFEPPENPDIEVKTDKLSINEATIKVLNILLPQITI